MIGDGDGVILFGNPFIWRNPFGELLVIEGVALSSVSSFPLSPLPSVLGNEEEFIMKSLVKGAD